MMGELVLIALLCATVGNIVVGLKSNEGKVFYVGFMENTNLGDVHLVITTLSNRDAQVAIYTKPGQPHEVKESRTVARGTSHEVHLSKIWRGSGNNVAFNGIVVNSSEVISVFALNRNPNSMEGFVALPIDALGKDYVISTWYNESEFMILASQNATHVRIKLSRGESLEIPFRGTTYKNEDEITVYLQQFQSIHIKAVGNSELSGTIVEANAPVAVFSGSNRSSIGEQARRTSSAGHVVEQLTPTSSWGKHFLVSPPFTDGGYFLKIYGQEGTWSHVNISKTISDVGILKRVGRQEFKKLELEKEQTLSIQVTGDGSPGVQVVLYAEDNVSGGPVMMVVPPLEQYRDSYTFATPALHADTLNHHLILLAKTTATSKMKLNGVNISATWSPVSGNIRGYSYSRMSIPHREHNIWSETPTDKFMAWVIGSNADNYVTYGFPVGFNLADIYQACQPIRGRAPPGDLIDNDCDGFVDEDAEGSGYDISPRQRANGSLSWTAWSSCSTSCGQGTRSRNQICIGPYNGGYPCPGPFIQSRSGCNQRECPECDAHRPCTKDKTQCVDFVCRCKYGYKNESGSCVIRRLDDQCSTANDCSMVPNSECVIKNNVKVCACKYRYIAVSNKLSCRSRTIGDSCKADDECFPPNTKCSTTNKCTCKDGYFAKTDDGKSCLLRGIGDACASERDCSPALNLSCHQIKKQCQCKFGYIQYEPKNMTACRGLRIGDNCPTEYKCQNWLNTTTCSSNTCECLTGYKPSSDKTDCEKMTLGDPCNDDQECLFFTENSDCEFNLKTCHCESGYYQRDASCIKRSLGDPCENDLDCSHSILNSTCDGSNNCSCQTGFERNGTSLSACRRRQLFAEACRMDQECSVSIANSRCHQNQCQCNTGYKPESDLTVCKLFALGSSCTYTEDCDTAVPNSQCTENKCECSSGYWPIGGKCINAGVILGPVFGILVVCGIGIGCVWYRRRTQNGERNRQQGKKKEKNRDSNPHENQAYAYADDNRQSSNSYVHPRQNDRSYENHELHAGDNDYVNVTVVVNNLQSPPEDSEEHVGLSTEMSTNLHDHAENQNEQDWDKPYENVDLQNRPLRPPKPDGHNLVKKALFPKKKTNSNPLRPIKPNPTSEAASVSEQKEKSVKDLAKLLEKKMNTTNN